MSDAFWTVFYNIRIQDLFDVAIIAILIYVILVWLIRIDATPPLAKVLVHLALSQKGFRIRTEPIVLN